MDHVLILPIHIIVFLARFSEPLSKIGLDTFSRWAPGGKIELLRLTAAASLCFLSRSGKACLSGDNPICRDMEPTLTFIYYITAGSFIILADMLCF